MDQPLILCIDDQEEILGAVMRDLAPLESHFDVRDCLSAEEAWQELEEAAAVERPIALLVCDHMMPGENGVDFLARVHEDGRFQNVRKILLTGMASHDDTIEAINRARIDRYISKPWEPEELRQAVRIELTRYVLVAGLDYQEYLGALDREVLMKELWRAPGSAGSE